MPNYLVPMKKKTPKKIVAKEKIIVREVKEDNSLLIWVCIFFAIFFIVCALVYFFIY